MLDVGGVLRCKIYQHTPGYFQIYILAESLGIEPGNVFLSNYKDAEGDWYIRIYANSVSKNKNKRKRRDLKKIPEFALLNSVYYNEAVKIWWDIDDDDERWFIQDIKASILLPIIKERSKIPNGLVYKDEYWNS